MRRLLPALALAASAALPAAAQDGWTPRILSDSLQQEIYLPDFSYAGYRWGEQPIPDAFPGHTVLDAADFGAVPDDREDDTAALQAAFAAAHDVDGPVLVRLPAGRLVLTDILYIERSDFVLQGAGPGDGGTTLYMPVPLESLPTPKFMGELEEYLLANDKRQRERERGVDAPFSLYSWSGGFIWTNTPGGRGKPYLSSYDTPPDVLAQALSGRRGEHEVRVSDAARIRPGQILQLNWYNRDGEDGSLIDYLYDGHADSLYVGERHWESPAQPLTRQEVTVLAVDGDRVTVKEPLLHDLRPEWTPDLTLWEPITEVGIEGIRFEFLYQEYRYHHVEYGFNAIYLTNTAHAWVRDVDFHNGDNGLLTDVCANVTVEDVAVYGRQYHYGVHYGDCYNMLARRVYVAAPVVHTFTFNTGSRMCVYTDCTATHAPTLDQHSGLNYQNLFDNVTLYQADPAHQPIAVGGAKYWKPSHAAFPVFWNVEIDFLFPRPDAPVPVSRVTDGPSARIVGLHANYPLALDYAPDPYVEGLNRPGIAVPSLYDYQLRQRLGDRAASRLQIDLAPIERARVLDAADRYLREAPVTVTAARAERSAGGPHDFYSEGDYWWPDPENPGGPYVRRDGLTNPDNFVAHRDAMRRLSQIVPALTAAYRLTDDTRYADHARRHLDAWFVDEATRMTPHLLYAQAISGRVTGRGIGIIDTIHLVEVAQAVQVLRESGYLDNAAFAPIRQWFADYLAWMTTHPYGVDERDHGNNHSSAWALQAAAFARLTGDAAVLADVRERFKTVLLPEQMAADGSFPKELDRTKPYGYSLFNLDVLAMVAQTASVPGDDLWAFTLPDGRGLRQALAYMAPYVADKSAWPLPPDVMYDDAWPVRHPALLFGGLALGRPDYVALWRTLEADPTEDEVVRNFPVRQPVLWLAP